MREIKFRAWDKHTKEMYQDILYDKKLEGGVRPWIIMQFTGLLDKNGKEIYESDILIWDNKTDEPDKDIPPITFENGSFVCGSDNLGDLDLDSMEVIGNIYENPELIKSEEGK